MINITKNEPTQKHVAQGTVWYVNPKGKACSMATTQPIVGICDGEDVGLKTAQYFLSKFPAHVRDKWVRLEVAEPKGAVFLEAVWVEE